jgi:hypothetical protein
MDHLPDLDLVRREMEEPYPSGRMSPLELGDTLARLVWESFSDMLADPEHRDLLGGDGEDEGSVPPERVSEELLILHLWAHTRAVELSFFRRVPEELVRESLDHLHRAVFEDMVQHGTPGAQIPVFEQRVSARYADYNGAARESDRRVGRAALEHLVSAGVPDSPVTAEVITDRIVEIAHPLRDYLEGVQLEP